MSFSPAWLALREPVDHDSRNLFLAEQVMRHFADLDHIRVVDLGCGTGSNLRATSLLLPNRQDWLLVDYDPALLDAARIRLAEWADHTEGTAEGLKLTKGDRRIRVSFRQADLAGGVAEVIEQGTDLVTASALFDLISDEWSAQFARVVAQFGAAFYTVLTYDGTDTFAPPHPLDHAVVSAFAAHQKQDKGFGIAAGPDAPDALARGFAAAGYRIEEAASPWDIRRRNAALANELLQGIAGAVGETAQVRAELLAEWLHFRLAATQSEDARLVVGHRDTFAWPIRAS